MPTDFPTSLDTFAAKKVIDLEDALEAVEAKLGVDGSADVTTVDYKVSTAGLQSALDGTYLETAGFTGETLFSGGRPFIYVRATGVAATDQANLQNALTAAGTLYTVVLDGKFKTTAPLNLVEYQSVISLGGSAHCEIWNQTPSSTVFQKDPSLHKCNYVTLKGISARSTGASSTARGFDLQGFSYGHFDDLVADRCKVGIYMARGTNASEGNYFNRFPLVKLFNCETGIEFVAGGANGNPNANSFGLLYMLGSGTWPTTSIGMIHVGTANQFEYVYIGTHVTGIRYLSGGSLCTIKLLYLEGGVQTAIDATGVGQGGPIHFIDALHFDQVEEAPINDPNGQIVIRRQTGIFNQIPMTFRDASVTLTGTGGSVVVSGPTDAILGHTGAFSTRLRTSGQDGLVIDSAGNVTIPRAVYSEINKRASDASSPAANKARLFLRDNGSGKMQYCMIGPTGAVQVIATEAATTTDPSVPDTPAPQLFTASGSVAAAPAGATYVRILCQGGSGGGGSGRRGAAGTARSGGGGGGGGATSEYPSEVADLTFPLTVTVGAAGVGGAAVSTNDTDGAAGTAGSVTEVLSGGSVILRANGGGGGGGGTATAGTAGAGSTGGMSGGGGGAAGASGAAGVGGVVGATSGGGGGGGVTSANVANNGGTGPRSGRRGGTVAGTAGVAPGGAGGTETGVGATSIPSGGGGAGGGGAGNDAGAGGAGGNGAAAGGGGGGGGASVNGSPSGAGGNGAGGYVLLVWMKTAP